MPVANPSPPQVTINRIVRVVEYCKSNYFNQDCYSMTAIDFLDFDGTATNQIAQIQRDGKFLEMKSAFEERMARESFTYPQSELLKKYFDQSCESLLDLEPKKFRFDLSTDDSIVFRFEIGGRSFHFDRYFDDDEVEVVFSSFGVDGDKDFVGAFNAAIEEVRRLAFPNKRDYLVQI